MVTMSDCDSRFNSSSIDRSDVYAMSINAGFLVAVQFFIKLIKLKLKERYVNDIILFGREFNDLEIMQIYLSSHSIAGSNLALL